MKLTNKSSYHLTTTLSNRVLLCLVLPLQEPRGLRDWQQHRLGDCHQQQQQPDRLRGQTLRDAQSGQVVISHNHKWLFQLGHKETTCFSMAWPCSEPVRKTETTLESSSFRAPSSKSLSCWRCPHYHGLGRLTSLKIEHNVCWINAKNHVQV